MVLMLLAACTLPLSFGLSALQSTVHAYLDDSAIAIHGLIFYISYCSRLYYTSSFGFRVLTMQQ